MKNKKGKIYFFVARIFLILIVVGLVIFYSLNDNSDTQEKMDMVDKQNIEDTELGVDLEADVEFNVEISLEDEYAMNVGNFSNLYYIDENGTLWGSGDNNYGQLGQGTKDYDYHVEMVKMAEDVIHVDYSQEGFVIWITKNHELYGVGNAGCGALQQLEEFSNETYVNAEKYAISTPVLLRTEVAYASCGRSDVVCIDQDQSVWTWGTVCFQGAGYYYCKLPVKIMDEAVYVTGGMYNHAALQEDGSLWTWGYNYTGNCGIANQANVREPQKVNDHVVMVWTGQKEKNVNCFDITEFEGYSERGLENTIIKKDNGEYYICGANVGEVEKILPVYFEAVDFPIVCSAEFLPYQW